MVCVEWGEGAGEAKQGRKSPWQNDLQAKDVNDEMLPARQNSKGRTFQAQRGASAKVQGQVGTWV